MSVAILVLLSARALAWDGQLPPDVPPPSEFDDQLKKSQQQLTQQYPHSGANVKSLIDTIDKNYHIPVPGQPNVHEYRRDLPASALPTRQFWAEQSKAIDAWYALTDAQANHASPDKIKQLQKALQAAELLAKSNPAGKAFESSMQSKNWGMPKKPATPDRPDEPGLLPENPSDPFGNVFNGNAKLMENDPGQAKRLANDALAVDPQNADAYSLRAAAEMDLKDYRAAAGDARTALGLNPDDDRSKAVLMLAHDAVSGKEPPIAPTDGGADGGVSAALGRGGARDVLTPSVSQSSYEANVLAGEAQRAISLGDYDAAVAQASRAIDLDPSQAAAFALRAMAEEKSGRLAAAAHDAAAALALDPANRLAQNVRGKALNEMRRYSDALAAADAGLRQNPRNAYLEYMRAMALNGLGDRAGALDSLRRAAAIDPRFQDAVDLAQQAPAEKDLAFLFPEDRLAAAKAALAAQRAAKQRDWRWLYGAYGIFGLAGVALLWWLLPWLSRLREHWGQRSPAVGRSETVASGLPTPLPTTLSQSGFVLRGQYRRLGQIGASVHGAVYEGLDLTLDRRVTIRKLRAEYHTDDRERLLAPARLAASLNHPGIAMLYAVLDEPDALYLVCEFAPGKTLRDVLALNGPLASHEALPLFRRLAQALDHAHGRGVAHGAVKASNIMVGQDGSPKLLDFGLGRGPCDPLGDREAFAVCLREAIAGLPPLQLDLIDARLSKRRGAWNSAAEVVDVVQAAVEAST